MNRFLIIGGLIALLFPQLTFAQHQQIPFLTVTTLRSGSIVTVANSGRVFGVNIDSTRRISTTQGIAAVRIQLRTLGRVTSPYEVQCFFSAKDANQVRYIYDVVKLASSEQFDDIVIGARDLLAEAKLVDVTNIRHSATGVSSTGELLPQARRRP